MLLGAHVSIAGGYMNALHEAKKLKMDSIQIFTKNQRFWKEKLVTGEEGREFRESQKKFGVKQAFSHAIYLISLGSENEEIVEKSVLSLAAELERCSALGLTHTVLHPGHTGGTTVDKAIERIGGHITRVLNANKKNKVKILLENTAGSGSSIGGKLEYLSDLLDCIKSPRMGICLDTCHAFAQGYDIRGTKNTEKFFNEVDKQIGLKRLFCIHLNDSKGALGSHIDRHAQIGEGMMGLETFAYIMQNFQHIPKVFELSPENHAHEKNMNILTKLAKR